MASQQQSGNSTQQDKNVERAEQSTTLEFRAVVYQVGEPHVLDPNAPEFRPNFITVERRNPSTDDGDVVQMSAFVHGSTETSITDGSGCKSSDGVAAAPTSTLEESTCTEGEVNGTQSIASGGNLRATSCDVKATSSVTRSGIFLSGKIESADVSFLVDTGADATVISLDTLKSMSKTLRTAFQDSTAKLQVADGTTVQAKGPVLCKVTVAERCVLEAVYAAPIADTAIMGLETMKALGLDLSVAGVRLLPSQPSLIRRTQVQTVRRVVASTSYDVPARSEMVVQGNIRGELPSDTVMISPCSNQGRKRAIYAARSLVTADNGTGLVRVMNMGDTVRRIRQGETIAEAEAVVLVSNQAKDETTQPLEEPEELPEHLRQLFEDTCTREQLDLNTRHNFRQLLIKHAGVFAKDDNDLGRTDLVSHDIDTGDIRPIRQPPRRIPTALQEEFDKEMQGMIDKGVIEQGQSPWASPVVLVRKKDGTLRFCVDYRRLNEKTEFDAYPLPRIDETLEALSGAKFFSTLDLLSGYWQVGLTPEARLKSAFCVRSGLYLWNVMPFGLCNAPSTFERLMESVLQNLQWSTCLIYLDDVVIFGRSEEELIQRMDTVFERLRAAGLKLKPRKCHLFARRTDYLGHVISADGIAVSPEKVAAVKDWPQPENVTDVRSFLGTANYYRRFCKDFASIAAPLHRLTDKGARFVWQAEHQQAFDHIKSMLCTAPVLAYPVANAPIILDTDASLTGIGAVLSQVIDGQERVLGYASKALSRTERNYCVTRRELLAVVFFIRHFRPYLYGREFTVRTDHASLKWLYRFKEPEGQLARWMETLSEYRFIIIHRDGKKHGNADGLSRQPCRQCGRIDGEEKEDELFVRVIGLQPAWSEEQLAKLQSEDEDISPVYTAVVAGTRPLANDVTAWPAAAKRYWQDWDRLRLTNGVLRRVWFDKTGKEIGQQLLVPRKMVSTLLQTAHDDPLAGHFAVRRTLKRIRQAYYWSSMAFDVRHWCRSCKSCGGRKGEPTRAHHTLQQDPVSEPVQRVAVDILGPLAPATSQGNLYVLVIVDYLTKWSEAYAIPDQTAETVANKIVEEFVCRYGIPEQLHSDQGRQFESELFTQMCQLLGIKKTRTTPLHPQSDGQTERMNRTLLDVLSKLCREHPSDWDRLLPFAMAAYRSSTHSTTEETPNRLMLGREVTTPVTLLAPRAPTEDSHLPWIETLHQRFRDTYETVLKTTLRSHRTQKAVFDRKAKLYQFAEGDRVWLYDPKRRRGRTPKLDAERWTGPFVIQRKLSGAVYHIKRNNTDKGRVVNIDRLAPYVVRDEQRFPDAEERAVNDTERQLEAAIDVEPEDHTAPNIAEQTEDAVETYAHYRRQYVPEDVTEQSVSDGQAMDYDDSSTGGLAQAAVTQSLTPPTQSALTVRARRQARTPAWLGDFVA